MIKRGLNFGVLLIVVLAVDQGAGAASINAALSEAATESGQLLVPADYAFNDLSVADYFDRDGDGKVSKGDIVLGALTLSSVITTNPGTLAVGQANLTDASGIFGFMVATAPVDGSGTPTGAAGDVTFTALDAAADAYLTGLGHASAIAKLGAGNTHAVYQGGSSTGGQPASGAFYDSAYSDGDLYATLTPTSLTVDFFASTDLAFLAAPGPPIFEGQNVAQFKLTTGLDIVDDGTSSGEGIGDYPIIPDFAGRDVRPTGTISFVGTSTALAGSGYLFNDLVDIKITTIIPTPSALGLGLVLLGTALQIRFRRQPV